MEIRRLEATDATELHELLRQALIQEPLAFVTSVEDEIASPVEAVRKHLERTPEVAVFGAFDQRMVGMLWFAREPREKLAHKALIWRAFVRKECRGRGVGTQLLHAAIEYASTLKEVSALWLGVSERSPEARRLYERHGFRVWGVEPDCLRHGGESANLYYLELRLN